ncbi:UNVERIFIED_CONTAM: hypothetical protein HDU68_006419, partial [Siphonaria sp. JEL0065]
EYPGGGGVTCNSASPDDAKNFAILLAALRTELGPRRSISIAVSAETDHYISGGVNYIPQYVKYVNYISVMTYDFYGSWVPNSDFNSPLDLPKASDPQQPAANNVGYNGHGITQMSAMRNWLAAGAPATQLTNGLAFYGRSWSVQSSANNGLYQLCTGSVNGGSCAGVVGDYLDAQSWCDPCGSCYNSGVWMYNNLRGQANSNGQQTSAPLANKDTASNGWTRKYFDFAASPTLYTSNYLNRPTFISYDDPQSIQVKAAWAKAQGFGGTMIWEISQDYNNEMINAVYAGWK